MASIEQIRDGEVYYSCNCGWLDEKHLNMCSQTLAGTPKGLWHQLMLELYAETGTPDRTHLCANSQTFNQRQLFGMACNQKNNGFVVQYQQNRTPLNVSTGIHGAYLVKYGLTTEQKSR